MHNAVCIRHQKPTPPPLSPASWDISGKLVMVPVGFRLLDPGRRQSRSGPPPRRTAGPPSIEEARTDLGFLLILQVVLGILGRLHKKPSWLTWQSPALIGLHPQRYVLQHQCAVTVDKLQLERIQVIQVPPLIVSSTETPGSRRSAISQSACGPARWPTNHGLDEAILCKLPQVGPHSRMVYVALSIAF